jgi:hypothetical protein
MEYSFLRNKTTFAAVVGVLALVLSVGVAAFLGAAPAELGLAIAGGIVVTVIVGGTYMVGRRYGHPHSHAVAEATVSFGVMYLFLLVYHLLTEFGTRSTGEAVTGIAAVAVGFLAVVGITVLLGRIGPSPN